MSTTLSRTTRYACGPAAAILILTAGLASPAGAGVDPLSGIDFVHITDPGNAPFDRPISPGFPSTRGSVDYEYRIGRTEVTTAQWVEFFNAAFDRPVDDRLPHLIPPTFWGAAPTTPTTPGGLRWRVPAGNEDLPVGNISWRMAAMYVNWLNNDKSIDRSAFLNGAYDVSTFGFTPGGTVTDQAAHNPNARYWIPTWDEWVKAAHYDPNANGGAGGWWEWSNGSNEPYVYGPPGVGEANAGWFPDYPMLDPFDVPLGAYPDVTSPWGLLDVAGGTMEWTELVQTSPSGTRVRVTDGSFGYLDAFTASIVDRLGPGGGEFPHVSSFEFGLRVAMVVPAPPSVVGAGVLLVMMTRRGMLASSGAAL